MFFRNKTHSPTPPQLPSRRQFLRGLGGFTLALPFLPSLLTRTALAQSAGAAPKRMVVFTTPHGAIWPQYMWPQESVANQGMSVYGTHTAHHGPLTVVDNALSPVLSSPLLTQSLADKMFLVRGCDIPFYIGHHSGGYLGNYNRNDLDGAAVVPMQNRVTIDQVMRHSPSFYGPGASITRPSIHIGPQNPNYGVSWGYVNPTAKSGVQGMATETSSLALFNDVFTGGQPSTPTAKSVVDRVYQQYSQLTSGAYGPANRLSALDRDRLEGYMSHLSELEAKLNATGSASCGDLSPPTGNVTNDGEVPCNPEVLESNFKLWNDVVVAAFMCDTSRIVTMQSVAAWDAFTCNSDSWHQTIVHECGNHPDTLGVQMADAVNLFFRATYMDLVTKLDAVQTSDGSTLLDESLVWWANESGPQTHESVSMPVVAAGGAGGFFQTGRIYDYRDRDSTMYLEPFPDVMVQNDLRHGLLWNQWLATVLQAMGVPSSEWEQGGVKGYGEVVNQRNYPQAIVDAASNVLPMITGA